MNNFYHSTASDFHNLVDWLALAGVTYEVGERTAYQAGMIIRAEKEVSQPDIAAPSPAALPGNKKTLPTNTISLPDFTSLEELNIFYKGFKDLGLCKTASCVLGTGSLTPQIMVISDIPEDQEDRSSLAFSGAANQMILKALGFAGLSHDVVYCTYLSKWRPPGKRALTSQETEICARLLREEVRLLRPRTILTLGESTLRAFSPDSLTNGNKIPFLNTINNQIVGYEIPFMASQKSEFLVKNALMKKSFWFSLLEFAVTIRP